MDKDKTVIKLENVTKTYKLYKNDKMRLRAVFFKNVDYKEKKAINNYNLEIKRGESVAFLGKNGAGKSTLLKMITGVAFPTSGEVHVDGRVSALLELRAGFDREFSGRDNIYFRCELMGLKRAEIKEREQMIIDFADIGEYIDQPVRMFSSGMSARLGFAININVDPDILIVDEALSVGDKLFRNKCIKKVNEVTSREGVTVLLVTHSTGTAKKFCKRGIVMDKGQIVFDGDIDEAIAVYDRNLEEFAQQRARERAEKQAQALLSGDAPQ